MCDSGTYSWNLRDQNTADDEGIAFPRRFVVNEEQEIAEPEELAARADGAPRWAVLRGDVDHFDLRLKRTNTIEEWLQLSVLFKEFFSGELSLLCTLPEFWRKVTILYRGGDDFAVIGAWDALVSLARELQRVFERFVAQNLQSFAGLEGKSVSMALAVAPAADSSPTAIFEQAGAQLQSAKATELGSFHLFGTDARMEAAGGCGRLEKRTGAAGEGFPVSGRICTRPGIGISRSVFGTGHPAHKGSPDR